MAVATLVRMAATSDTGGSDVPRLGDAPLGDVELMRWVHAQRIAARLVVPGVPTPTVPEAAAALGVAPDQVLKSLVFLVRGEPLLVIAAGEDRVRYPALAAALGVGRRAVRMASAEEALNITGYEVGAMPPFGHRRSLATLVDARAVAADRLVYAGGGTRAALLELRTDELLRATAARSVELTVLRDDADEGDLT